MIVAIAAAFVLGAGCGYAANRARLRASLAALRREKWRSAQLTSRIGDLLRGGE